MKRKLIILPFAAIAGLVFALISGCTNPLKEHIQNIVYAEQQAYVWTEPDFSTIVPDTPIHIVYSEAVDRASLVMGGDLAEEAEFSWVIPDYGYHYREGDLLLVLTPKTAWPAGSGLTLTADCNDTEGYPTPSVSRSMTVVDGALYVSPYGDDAAPGKKDLPMKSIAAAAELAAAINTNWTAGRPITRLYAAEGTYTEPHIDHTPGTVLEGGWNSDWSEQDPDTYPTVIKPDIHSWTDPPEGDSIYSVCAVRAGECGTGLKDITITVETPPIPVCGIYIEDCSPVISGVSIAGNGGERFDAFRTVGYSAPQFSECGITVTDCTETRGFQFLVTSDEKPGITECSVTLTDCTAAYGVDSESTCVEIMRSDFDLHGTAEVYGINGFSADHIIRNNVINVSSDTPQSTAIYAIAGTFSAMTIQNNTIIYPVYGIYSTARSNPVVENNLFLFQDSMPAVTDGAGYYAGSADSHPMKLRNNRFSNYERAYNYVDEDSNESYYEHAQLAVLETDLTAMGREASGNTATTDDESSYFAEDWDLAGTVPPEIGEGGRNLSGRFTEDKKGRSRPAAGGWTVGAYQKP